MELPDKEGGGRFRMIKLEHLEVWRETRPDQKSFDEHWDTWCADEKKDAEPPTQFHYEGKPATWTGET